MENTKKQTEVNEEVQEQQDRSVNKVVAKALFLSAQKSEKSGKLGITILLYESIDEATRQVKVALDQKTIKGQSYTLSPVISTWIDSKDITPMLESFLKKDGLTDVYAIVSGNGDFRKIHKFLTKEEYENYLALVG